MLETAISQSREFLRRGNWFDAAALIGGRNSDRRWYAEQLLTGKYRERNRTATACSPEAIAAWQRILNAAHRQVGSQEAFAREIGDECAVILKQLGLSRRRIDEATESQRLQQKCWFCQSFDQKDFTP